MENLDDTEALFVDLSNENDAFVINDSSHFNDSYLNCSTPHIDVWNELSALNNGSNLTEWLQRCDCSVPESWTQEYAAVGTLFQGIIFLVGVLGNVLVCTVVIKTRSMRTTTNCYLVSLAVADTITLITSVPQEVLSYHILAGKWVWGSVGCTLMIYLQVRK